MAMSSLHQKSALVAAAMAASATGLFVAAGPAQALPPAPLAPAACQQWIFNGTSGLKMSTGETVIFESSTSNVDEPATWIHPEGPRDTGKVTGHVDPNGQVNITWFDETHTIPFTGQVGPDGVASGTRPGGDSPVPWHTVTPLFCGVKGDATAPQGNSREVTGDVEVYDVPGGVGTVIGTLAGGDGQRVQLGSGCKDDHWCNVVWPAGPGGTGWVWGDFLK
jgi:hypothetical protein